VKVPWYWLLGLGLMMLSAIVLSALQTSLWFQLFGRFPAPMFWLITLVYFGVTRPLWEATLGIYLLVIVCAPFTVFPFAAFLVYALMLMLILILIRERVFWGGSTYFMLMVGVACVSAPILFWICSRWFDKNPLFLPAIFDWLIASGLTALFSLPLYRLYQWIDKIASQDAGADVRVGPR
jgi:hypothetical protein